MVVEIGTVEVIGTIPGTKPQMGTELYDRASVLVVGNTRIQNIGQQVGINIWFEVRRNLKPKEPNTLDLKLYNLKDDTRESIEQYLAPIKSQTTVTGNTKKKTVTYLGSNQGVPVSLTAGYVGATSQIFLGLLRTAQTTTDGVTTTMELNSGADDAAQIVARTNANFGTGTTAYIVAQQLLTDMGVGQGNIATVKSQLQAPLYKLGVTLKGNSLDLLVDLATSCGLEVTLQGGVAQWTLLGQPLGGQAFGLDASTGLLGSPGVDSKGILNADTLMLPGLAPGMPILMASKYVQGFFRITSMITTGEVRGVPWGHSLEAVRWGNAVP